MKNPRKIAVFTFGRMNPPTRAHQALVEYGQQVAEQQSISAGTEADYFLFPSHTVDVQPKTKPLPLAKYRNPLPITTKLAFLREVFPLVNIINDPQIKSPQQVSEYLSELQYTDVTFVVGSDRVSDFEARWLPYTPQLFWQAQVAGFGDTRTEFGEGICGMSATKAREAAIDGSLDAFQEATGWDADFASRLLTAVREGMGLHDGQQRQSVQDQVISS